MQEQFKDELTITATAIMEDTVAVCISGEELLGFCQLCVSGKEAELAELFVSPDLKRNGIGHHERTAAFISIGPIIWKDQAPRTGTRQPDLPGNRYRCEIAESRVGRHVVPIMSGTLDA